MEPNKKVLFEQVKQNESPQRSLIEIIEENILMEKKLACISQLLQTNHTTETLQNGVGSCDSEYLIHRSHDQMMEVIRQQSQAIHKTQEDLSMLKCMSARVQKLEDTLTHLIEIPRILSALETMRSDLKELKCHSQTQEQDAINQRLQSQEWQQRTQIEMKNQTEAILMKIESLGQNQELDHLKEAVDQAGQETTRVKQNFQNYHNSVALLQTKVLHFQEKEKQQTQQVDSYKCELRLLSDQVNSNMERLQKVIYDIDKRLDNLEESDNRENAQNRQSNGEIHPAVQEQARAQEIEKRVFGIPSHRSNHRSLSRSKVGSRKKKIQSSDCMSSISDCCCPQGALREEEKELRLSTNDEEEIQGTEFIEISESQISEDALTATFPHSKRSLQQRELMRQSDSENSKTRDSNASEQTQLPHSPPLPQRRKNLSQYQRSKRDNLHRKNKSTIGKKAGGFPKLDITIFGAEDTFRQPQVKDVQCVRDNIEETLRRYAKTDISISRDDSDLEKLSVTTSWAETPKKRKQINLPSADFKKIAKVPPNWTSDSIEKEEDLITYDTVREFTTQEEER